jgi:hypothetical protein
MLIPDMWIPPITLWQTLTAEEPQIESLVLASTNNTDVNKNSHDSEKEDIGSHIPVEFLERFKYDDYNSIKQSAMQNESLWEKLQQHITVEDVPRVLSTPPWPIVNEIAVEISTKTTFDIVNLVVERTCGVKRFLGPTETYETIMIAGQGAFTAPLEESSSSDAKSNLMAKDSVHLPSSNNTTDPTTGIDDPEPQMKATKKLIPDRPSGIVTFYADPRGDGPPPKKKKATNRTRTKPPSNEEEETLLHKHDPHAKPAARFAELHHPHNSLKQCFVPGELKITFKFRLELLQTVNKDGTLDETVVHEAEKVFTQIYNYMNYCNARYGYVLTNHELLMLERIPGQFGRLKVSQSIPLSVVEGQLNAKLALWWLFYKVSSWYLGSTAYTGAYLPMTLKPRNYKHDVMEIRAARWRYIYEAAEEDGVTFLTTRLNQVAVKPKPKTPRNNESLKPAAATPNASQPDLLSPAFGLRGSKAGVDHLRQDSKVVGEKRKREEE